MVLELLMHSDPLSLELILRKTQLEARALWSGTTSIQVLKILVQLLVLAEIIRSIFYRHTPNISLRASIV